MTFYNPISGCQYNRSQFYPLDSTVQRPKNKKVFSVNIFVLRWQYLILSSTFQSASDYFIFAVNLVL